MARDGITLFLYHNVIIMDISTRLAATILRDNPPLTPNAYSGYYYAFYGSGGYSTDQSFNPITLLPPDYADANFELYDVTYALQVKYDVRTLNKKLGLIKDASNINIVQSSYDPITERYPVDVITIDAAEFVDGMKSEQVISTGSYTNMYSDYLQSVNLYFSGFASPNLDLFSEESLTDISAGTFDSQSFVNLIAPIDYSGNITYPLNGIITISNIHQLLTYAINNNIFDNRYAFGSNPNNVFYVNPYVILKPDMSNNTVVDEKTNTVTIYSYDFINTIFTVVINDNSNNTVTTQVIDYSNNTILATTINSDGQSIVTIDDSFSTYSSFADVSYSMVDANYTLADGFVAGDLIFVPSGTSIQLQILVDPYFDNSSVNIIDLIEQSGTARDLGLAKPVEGVDLSSISLNSSTIINRILTAPLLIQLANLSTE